MWGFLGICFSFGKVVFHESKASYGGSRVGNFKKGLLWFGKVCGMALSPHRRRSGAMPALIRLGSLGTPGAAVLRWTPGMGASPGQCLLLLPWVLRIQYSLPVPSCVGMFCLGVFLTLITAMLFWKEGCLPWVLGRRQVYPLGSRLFNWRCVCAGCVTLSFLSNCCVCS